ncbi:MAG: lysophospholipid acyltransferase family protein [Alphaproteobacteria bacterium]
MACWLVARYLRLLGMTGRWSVEGGDIPARLVAEGQPFVLAFWHGRFLMMVRAWPFTHPVHMLISRHPDGQLISRTLNLIGIRTLAGSTSHGGTEGLRAMIRLLRQGDCISITPDGPHGPRMRASAGVVQTARLAGVPILPATCAASSCKVIGSWDRLVVPLPFGRGIIAWGEPIEVARDADDDTIEAARLDLENQLNHMTRDIETRLGLAAIEPAEALETAGGKP